MKISGGNQSKHFRINFGRKPKMLVWNKYFEKKLKQKF